MTDEVNDVFIVRQFATRGATSKFFKGFFLRNFETVIVFAESKNTIKILKIMQTWIQTYHIVFILNLNFKYLTFKHWKPKIRIEATWKFWAHLQ